MIEYPYDPISVVTCTCCGAWVENTPEHNVSLHEEEGSLYPHDDGVGECIPCGGDFNIEYSPDLSEEMTRKRLGWGAARFYDSRIETLSKALNEENREKFETMRYAKKCVFVRRAIEDGILRW